MQISTGQLFDRGTEQMSAQKSKVSEMQAKLSSGKQILNPSDDAEKAGTIQRIKTAAGRQDSYQQTLNTINDRLSTEDAALRSVDNVMQRVRVLAVQASSDTATASDREILAVEVDSLRGELLALTNMQDSTGNYVFSGSKMRTAPYQADSSGAVTYQGDNNIMEVNVSDQRRMAVNRPGNDVFTPVLRDEDDGSTTRIGFFTVLEDFMDSLQANDGDGARRALTEVSQVTDNLSLSLASVGGRINEVDAQFDILGDTKIRFESMLSDAEDLDYAKAVSDLTAEMLSLEAGQASFARISQISLFDYIR
jgi:flagellar hook-associated protein 3 FlgL